MRIISKFHRVLTRTSKAPRNACNFCYRCGDSGCGDTHIHTQYYNTTLRVIFSLFPIEIPLLNCSENYVGAIFTRTARQMAVVLVHSE
jgi:hypothetical protein